MALSANLKPTTEAALANLNPMQHLQALNFPRRSGTDGEVRAAAYVAQVLTDIGYEPVTTEFLYEKPKLRQRLMRPLVFLTWLVFGLVNIWYWDNNLLASLVVLALPTLIIVVIFNYGRVMRLSIRRRIKNLNKANSNNSDINPERLVTSRNVVAEIAPSDAAQEILFTAHFDSIASKIPMRVSIIATLLWLIGFLAYTILYVANVIGGNFLADNFAVAAIFAGVLAVLLGLIAASRAWRTNESHGVVDNGTGVAILLELAKFLQTHPIPNTKFIFGFYGSEEVGLLGSTYDYIHRNVDSSKMRVITVDMIGEKPPLAYIKGLALVKSARMDAAFNEQIVELAEGLDIEIVGKRFPYPGSDFAPFMLDGGCTANWFINGSRVIHSKNDHLGNVNEELVNDALKLIVAYFIAQRNQQA